MTHAQRIQHILNRKPADRTGLWLGNPDPKTKEIYFRELGVKTSDELSQALQDDLIWEMAEPYTWRHPAGKCLWDFGGGRMPTSVINGGCFAECEDLSEVEAFDWPNPDYLMFDDYLKRLDAVRAQGKAVFGGFWTYIVQISIDFFGMENLFVKMFTNPAVVEAVIGHVVDFYLEANRRLFEKGADKLDAFFWANDMGSQTDILISPECFRRFYLPGFKKIVDLAKRYGLKVMLHSCGAISKIIPDLIDIGVDGLHPLQAKAVGMDARSLAVYKNDLTFMGGVDTQEILPFGTPDEVKAEVTRLKELWGDRFIVSPSHEGVLPDIPLANIVAMCDAARGC